MAIPVAARVRRLRAFYAQLNEGHHAVKKAGGLRSVVTRLKSYGYKPGRTMWYEGIQRIPNVKQEYVVMSEPRYGSTVMVERGSLKKASIPSHVQQIRREFKRAKRIPRTKIA